MRAVLSVLGMLNADSTVLDGLGANIPDGVSFDDLTDNIIQECAELEITIPRPDTFKYLVSSWARRKKLSWQRYYDAITAEYNPLENYDRQETFTDAVTGSHSGSETNTGSQSERNAGTDSETETRRGTLDTTTSQNGRDAGSDTETETKSGRNAGSDNETISRQTVLDGEHANSTRTVTDNDETVTYTDTRTPNITIEEKVAAFNSSTYENKSQKRETGTETNGRTGANTSDTIVTVTESGTQDDETTETGTIGKTHDHTITENNSLQKSHDYTKTESGSVDSETSENGTRQLSQDHTRTLTDSLSKQSSGSENKSVQHTGRAHGNIGVTTSQQMLISELDLTGRLDIYAYITQDFKAQFCVLIY